MSYEESNSLTAIVRLHLSNVDLENAYTGVHYAEDPEIRDPAFHPGSGVHIL